MKFLRLPALMASIGLLSVPAMASELDLALSEDTAAAELLIGPDRVNISGAGITLGGEYNDDDDALLYVGLSSIGGSNFNQAPALQFGVGGRLYYASIDQPDQSISAIALGGHGRLDLSGTGFPVALAGSVYVAPDITTFMDGDDLLDARIRVEADVSPNATAFVGYREVDVGLKSFPDRKVDEDIHAGVRFKF